MVLRIGETTAQETSPTTSRSEIVKELFVPAYSSKPADFRIVVIVRTASASGLSARSIKLSRFGQAIWIFGLFAINIFVSVQSIGYNPRSFAIQGDRKTILAFKSKQQKLAPNHEEWFAVYADDSATVARTVRFASLHSLSTERMKETD